MGNIMGKEFHQVFGSLQKMQTVRNYPAWHLRSLFQVHCLGGAQRRSPYQIVANPDWRTSLFSARPIGPFSRTASEQNEQRDEISKTLRVDTALAGVNVTAGHTPRLSKPGHA